MLVASIDATAHTLTRPDAPAGRLPITEVLTMAPSEEFIEAQLSAARSEIEWLEYQGATPALVCDDLFVLAGIARYHENRDDDLDEAHLARLVGLIDARLDFEARVRERVARVRIETEERR